MLNYVAGKLHLDSGDRYPQSVEDPGHALLVGEMIGASDPFGQDEVTAIAGRLSGTLPSMAGYDLESWNPPDRRKANTRANNFASPCRGSCHIVNGLVGNLPGHLAICDILPSVGT